MATQQYSELLDQKNKISLGYYNLRGKAQVARLLCEYLKVQYNDLLFSLQSWGDFKKTKAKEWVFPDLPFLKEGPFIITEPIPICLYIISRFGYQELLGKNLHDKSIVDMYLWNIQKMASLIALTSQRLTIQQMNILKQKQWNQFVKQKLNLYDKMANQQGFYLGYLTIIDFSIYELCRYMDLIFPGKVKEFKNLKRIQMLIGQLPEIKAYQNSQRCVRQMCPSKLLEELKKNKEKEALKASEKVEQTKAEQTKANAKEKQIQTNQKKN